MKTIFRCLLFKDGTKIGYPKNMPVYDKYTSLTVDEYGKLCPCKSGDPIVCYVDEVTCL